MAADRDLEPRARELSAIYDTVPGIIFYVAVEPDGEFRFVSMSQSGLLATGLTREQLEGRPAREVIPPSSIDMVLDHYRDAIQFGRTVRWKEVSVYPAGRRVGEVAVTPVYDANGLATHLIGIVHDVTARASLEDALLEREERLAFLLKLDDVIQPLSDPTERQQAAARLLAEHLKVDRVCYADIGEGSLVRHTYSPGGRASVHRGPISPLGTALLATYERERVVAIDDVTQDARLLDGDRETLLAGEVAAFAGVFIEKGRRQKGAFGVHSATPRTWRPAEVALIRDVAERTWEAVERARAETNLREREQRLRLALEASGGGSWTWDVRANQVDWDPAFRVLYGIPADDPPSHEAWFSRVHEDDRPRMSHLLGDLLNATAEAWDDTFRIVRPDGAVAWIQSFGRADRGADGQLTRLTGLELDITERRRAEDALRARQDEERDSELRLLLETAAQGIVSVDAHGRIIMANRAMETMFGYENGALIGQSIEQLVPSSSRVDHGVDLELVGRRQDGSTFPVEVTVNQVVTPTGGRAIAFVTDISARKRAESALHDRTLELQRRTSQLSQMASDLTLAEQRAREELATTLHDGLQQLLAASAMSLDQHLQRASRVGVPPAELIEAKKLLEEAIAAARSLSVELYPPLLKSAGLPTTLDWLANWMHDKYGLKAHVVADPHADSTRSDVRTLLFESVRELLFNVVKHAGVNKVDVALARDANDMLCITVTDAGVGFDAASLAERTETGGRVGWGLFSIRERLTLLGGRFEIDSAPGKGTRFSLIAPGGVTTAAPSAGARAAAPVESSRALRVLLVDDHGPMRNALRELLHARHELCVVGDASDGLEAIVQAHALHPDVILMDVSMPRMDGVEATRRIRVELPFVQVLGLSIQSRTADLHPIEQAGAAGFFTKGADTRRLVDRLLAIHAEIEPRSEVARA